MVAGGALLVGTNGAKYVADNKVKFVTYDVPPFLTNSSGERTTTITAGRGIILNIEGIRQNYRCWGEYVTSITGPVTYTFPNTYSQILQGDGPTRYKISVFFEVPKDLPPGQYAWVRQGKPTCQGAELAPFPLDMHGLTMTVVAPKT